MRIGKDPMRFRVRSEIGGYLYVFVVGTDGTSVAQLFPNALDSNNRVPRGTDFSLPRQNWTMTAGGPPGVDRFLAIVSARPRDFASAGLRPGKPFSVFDLEAARRVVAAGGASALTGQPDCGAATKAECGLYAAAQFEIREVP